METIKPSVLVVEDYKLAQKMAEIILNQLNCHVDTADTGAQALELINKRNYDLIFMDLGLPDMDGLTVTETIRKLQGKNNLPIIALTAHTESDVKDNCLNVGMNDIMGKPISLEAAKEMLEKYTKKASTYSPPKIGY